MKVLKNFNLKTFFSNKKVAITFSIIAAFIFWLVIEISANPDREISLNRVSFSVDSEGTSLERLDLTIVEHNIDERMVAVTVNGPSYVVSSLRSDDFLVYPDLTSIQGEGTYEVMLLAEQISGKNGCEIISVTPRTVTLKVDKISDKYFGVEVQANNISVDVGSDPDLSFEFQKETDDELHIMGPKKELDKIAKVVAVVDESEVLTSSKVYNSEIKLYDASGNELDSSVFTFDNTMDITVKVFKTAFVKLVPSFNNRPSNAPILKYKITSENGDIINTVAVKGSPDVINSQTEISLPPINSNEIDKNNNSFVVYIKLPSDNLMLVDNLEKVIVTFDLSGYEKKSAYLDLKVSVVGNSSGLSVTKLDAKSFSFYVPKSANIGNIKAEDIEVIADLTGKTVGQEVTVSIRYIRGNAWFVGKLPTVKVI